MEKEEAEGYLHKKVENGELISPVLPWYKKLLD